MQNETVEVGLRGKFYRVKTVRIGDKQIIINGKLIKIASIHDERFNELENPLEFIKELNKIRKLADVFTFRQKFPETKRNFNFYMESDDIAAVHLDSYEHWFKKQISENARRGIKKALKEGVTIKNVHFDDEFIRGMVEIFNEEPLKQNKPNWNYGKSFETVKREFSKYLNRQEHIGAYYNNELIGFNFLTYSDRYAEMTQIISKVSHQDKSPNNALIAEAVKICTKKGIPHLVYGMWTRGLLTEFRRRNGFKKLSIPRYYIPLTNKGKFIIYFHLHKGLAGLIPEKMIRILINLRTRWYTKKYKK